MKPIYIHSGMVGAPQSANVNGCINGILEACLINGFNTRTATSASASGGVLTLNFSSNPGFEALQTVEVALADVVAVNGRHQVLANSNNQVTIAIPGLTNGAVGSSGAGITVKQASVGWSMPFSSGAISVFRPPAGSRHYLRMNNSLVGQGIARGYESMSDINTGTWEFPTTEQSADGLYVFGQQSAATYPWFLLATDKWVIMSRAQDYGNQIIYADSFIFFGDLAQPVKNGSYASVLLTRTSGYFARNYAGSSNATAGVNVASLASYGYSELVGPVAGFLFLPYVSVSDEGAIERGVLPNFYRMNPWNSSYRFADVRADISGIDGRVRPCFIVNDTNGARVAVSLDEEDWA